MAENIMTRVNLDRPVRLATWSARWDFPNGGMINEPDFDLNRYSKERFKTWALDIGSDFSQYFGNELTITPSVSATVERGSIVFKDGKVEVSGKVLAVMAVMFGAVPMLSNGIYKFVLDYPKLRSGFEAIQSDVKTTLDHKIGFGGQLAHIKSHDVLEYHCNVKSAEELIKELEDLAIDENDL